jgi:shikimate kinase
LNSHHDLEPTISASATSNSAISVLNAIGSGLGGAIGIDIRSRVRATLRFVKSKDHKNLRVRNTGAAKDQHGLIPKCVKYVLNYLDLRIPEENEIVVEVDSDIPVAVGLKSSSAVSSAVIAAVSKLLSGKDLEAKTVLELSCKASIDSHVSVTGAFDDAVSCFLGGLVLTNNRTFSVLRHARFPSNLGSYAIVRIPRRVKVYTSSVRKEIYSPFRKSAEDAFRLAIQRNISGAMMLNSLIQCSALGYSFDPVMTSILEGATCAGVSGKGPAIAAICTSTKTARQIEKRWHEENKNSNREIEVIKTRVVQPRKLLIS